jgi:hypothetical protein
MTDSDWGNIWHCAFQRLSQSRNPGDWDTAKMAANIKVR